MSLCVAMMIVKGLLSPLSFMKQEFEIRLGCKI